MAGDWIKIENTTPDKPEVFAIAEYLNIHPEHAFGCLCVLWIWADQQTIDGNAANVTKTLVDRKTGVPNFAEAMISVGWLLMTDTGLQFVNFDRHNGETAKQRALTAKRVAKYRVKSNAESNGAVVTRPLAREEKRREENKPSSVDDSEFADFWSLYPKRAGGNSKPAALKAWAARVKSGVSPGDMISGVKRYAVFIRATEKENTEFVKMASSFLGPSEFFMEDWAIPRPKDSHFNQHSSPSLKEYIA